MLKMSKIQPRVVNVVPNVKIKKEVISDEEEQEDCIGCRVCNKVFASTVALRNHVRMEHIEVFCEGDPAKWTQEVDKDPKQTAQKMIKIKTDNLISSMAPTNLMSLASQDVSYIIIKAEDGPPQQVQVRKRKAEKIGKEKVEKVKRDAKEKEKEEKVEKVRRDAKEKEKEVIPITGPFECLQPSAQVADGTCHQIFFSCCEYSVHFRDEHTRRRKGLRCQVCEKPLCGSGEYPIAGFSCDVCGQGFDSNKDLSEHVATDHVKLKPFQCSVCYKRFTQQGGVHQHMRMHTGDRPFNCTFCPKSFTQKSGLDQHVRIHTKVKPYRCVICSKTFCQSVHLRQHMRTHTNVSPFQCGICSKRFKQSSHLNYHLKNHNQLNMTDEEKKEYRKLVSMIINNEKRNVVLIDSQDGTMQLMEIEDQMLQTEEIQEEVETVEPESLEAEVLIDEEEQILAEQSIQVEHEEEYILDDVIQII